MAVSIGVWLFSDEVLVECAFVNFIGFGFFEKDKTVSHFKTLSYVKYVMFKYCIYNKISKLFYVVTCYIYFLICFFLLLFIFYYNFLLDSII